MGAAKATNKQRKQRSLGNLMPGCWHRGSRAGQQRAALELAVLQPSQRQRPSPASSPQQHTHLRVGVNLLHYTRPHQHPQALCPALLHQVFEHVRGGCAHDGADLRGTPGKGSEAGGRTNQQFYQSSRAEVAAAMDSAGERAARCVGRRRAVAGGRRHNATTGGTA